MNSSQHILGALGTLAMTFFGIGGVKFGNALAEASQGAIPDWSRYLLGPLGSLVGMIFAVRWLANRLNRVEEQARKDQEALQKAILEQMTKYYALVEQNNRVIQDNTEAINRLAP